MMACKTIKRQLSAYLDNALRQDEMESIQDHLKHCPSCQKALSELSKLWDVLAEAHVPEPEPFAYTRLKIRIKQAGHLTSKWVERKLLPIALTCALILGIFAGNRLGIYHTDSVQSAGVLSSLEYLNLFQDFPESSLGSAYYNYLSSTENGGGVQ